MRVLAIGPEEQAAIRMVVAYAIEPEHFFRTKSGIVPGDNPAHVVHVPNGFRCVFTLTRHRDKLYRQLSISVPDPQRYPSPEACVMLAKEFGFTASSDSLDVTERIRRDQWIVDTNEADHCVVLAQPAGKETPA